MGLCYNCDEKFVRGHNKVCKSLFLLDSAVDDTEEAPESSEPVAAEEELPMFSLHAIAGVRFTDTMQLNVQPRRYFVPGAPGLGVYTQFHLRVHGAAHRSPSTTPP